MTRAKTLAMRAHGALPFVLLGLLAACASDDDPALAPSCTPPAPVGCQCIGGAPVCNAMPSANAGAMAPAQAPMGLAMMTNNVSAPPAQMPAPASTPGAPTPTDDTAPGDPLDMPDGGSDEQPPAQVPDAGMPVDDPPPATGDGVVGEHGALHVQGNQVVDQQGQPIQLRGMSLFWSQWTDFYVPQNVDVMADDWEATLVRAALGVENDGGYLQDPGSNVAKVRAVVDRAIARGLYVIIDWHDHHAQDHASQATAFFREMAQAYGKRPHVIFEVYNEPVDVPWSVVKAYAEPVIRTIRDAGADNLIIVGTPTWSQDVDLAANDPIRSDDNVAYTLHFYANTHRQSLRDKAQTALDRGIALFVTEWGTCSADGNGSIDEGETRTWLGFLKDHGISWANWALNNKAEACSAVQPSGGSVGPWRDDQLTPSGRLVKGAIP